MLVVASSLTLATTASQAEVSSTMHASVGPDFQISFTFDDNSAVRSAPAGTYTVVVNDLGTNHNFHLQGPGVDQATSIDATEQVSWTVNLADASKYAFQCDRHPGQLNGSFTVGNYVEPAITYTLGTGFTTGGGTVNIAPGSSTTGDDPVPSNKGLGSLSTTLKNTTSGAKTATASSSAETGAIASTTPGEPALMGLLRVDVASNGKVHLSRLGHSVKKLDTGSYTLLIVDGGKRSSLTIAQSSGGKFRHTFTTDEFTGSLRSSITLRPGHWKITSGHGQVVINVPSSSLA